MRPQSNVAMQFAFGRNPEPGPPVAGRPDSGVVRSSPDGRRESVLPNSGRCMVGPTAGTTVLPRSLGRGSSGRHRNGSDAAMLPGEFHDAPSTVPLLDVGERQRCYLRPAEWRSESQFPVRTPMDFAPFTRRIPSAIAGASNPLSATPHG
jgi:hypothetical protein